MRSLATVMVLAAVAACAQSGGGVGTSSSSAAGGSGSGSTALRGSSSTDSSAIGTRASSGGSSASSGSTRETSGTTAGSSGRGSTSLPGSTSSGESSTSAAHGSTSSSGTSGLGPTIDALVGLNGFITDPLSQLGLFGSVREYHDWTWDDGNGASGYSGYPNSQLQFVLWNGAWDFDAYYATLADAGTLVLPCIEGSVGYLNNAMPPVAPGADPTQPSSYAAHASFMFQYAARYGSVAVPSSDLQLAAGQTVVSGLGLLHYYEDGNEPDNNWTSGNGSPLFSPEEYAAMASADYDGDQGRMGSTLGLKSADPNAQMVMAGLAMAGSSDAVTNATAYLEGVRQWAVSHRGGSFPADVLNIHQYCFGPSGNNPGPGLAPEACGLGALLSQMVAYRDQHLPGMQLWLTEFGYDTNPASILRAPAIGATPADVVQGQWLVRSILAIAESGVDRATLFVSQDGCSESSCSNASVQFTTSGIWTDSTMGFTPKASYYLLAGFRSSLAGLSFKGRVSLEGAPVSVDAFANAAGQGAYVVWSPTSAGTTVSGYSLAIPGATQATQVQLSTTSVAGTSAPLTISSGSVTLDASETPIIVQVDHVP